MLSICICGCKVAFKKKCKSGGYLKVTIDGKLLVSVIIAMIVVVQMGIPAGACGVRSQLTMIIQ